MHCLTVLYGVPDDVEAFDSYYEETHLPLTMKIRQITGYTVQRPQPGPDGTPPEYHLVACLYAESAQSLARGLSSPAGRAMTADLPNFATGGATMLIGDVEAVLPVTLPPL